MPKDNLLFCEGDLDATLRSHQISISSRVDSIPRDQFLNTSIEELTQHILSTLLVEPLILYEDRAEMEQRETKIDVSGWRDRNPFGDLGPINVAGIEVVVTIPYSGDQSLWKLRPNRWQSIFPHADIRGTGRDGIGGLQISLSQPADESPERFKSRLDEELRSIRFYVDAQRLQIEQFNAGLTNPISSAISARRERLQRNEGIQNLLGIPLKQKEGTPSVEPIRIARKLVRPLPPPPKAGYQAEPGITDEDYRHILSVIRHEGRTFEATPKTYAVHDEEELRDILLAHLNGHYQGAAAGEAFRRTGKTDIRIEDQSRAAFVAECKVWRGAKEFSPAIDQLLGYLTWRDCKAALIVFNKKNAKFSELLDRIPDTVQAHEKFIQTLIKGQDGEWEFLMTSREDEARQVRVHVFVFNIYAA
ncbi:MAG: hypothetical protein Q8K46_03130 [Deltaproteobacteria bacterium]|nr:hypothetical protein [Deltaproteobacteria bacterium]